MLQKTWNRFRSEVPPVVKKVQIVLGMAAGSFTAGTLINWPGKLAAMGTFCGYGAAFCTGIPIALQFIQKTVTVFETKTEVTETITKTTTVTE